MRVKRIFILSGICVLLLLAGCSNNSNSFSNNNTSNIETSVKSTSEKESTSVRDTTQAIDLSIPKEFVDYYKFIGMDISVLNVDTSEWNFDDFSHYLWKGTFYGHNGEIKVELGWDNKTITDFFLILNDKEKIKDEEREAINKKVMSIYGNNMVEENISYEFSGSGDYVFSVPKTLKQKSCCWISWTDDIKIEYVNSKPKEPTSEEETTQPKVKLQPAIGMTAEEVEESAWGKPRKKNKTTTAYGVHEQWVYSSERYIYLDDGIVTAIQE